MLQQHSNSSFPDFRRDFFLAPSSQEMESLRKSGRFTPRTFTALIDEFAHQHHNNHHHRQQKEKHQKEQRGINNQINHLPTPYPYPWPSMQSTFEGQTITR
jgi:hypothetical protein